MRRPLTMSARVIIHALDPAPLIAVVQADHPDIVIQGCDSYAALPEMLATFRPDVVFSIRFAGTPTFPCDALLGPNGPKWIAVGGSGVDHLGQWDAAVISVTNSAGVAANMMAEYVFGGFLHFSLDISGLARDKHHHHWDGTRTMKPLAGNTLLIIGLGHTGQAIAQRAKAFAMHVIGTRARPKPTEYVDTVYNSTDLPKLLGQADYIVVCAPLLDSTRGLIDADAFAAMQPGTIIADVSRGGIIDQQALLAALNSGHISAAVLDVFEREPLAADAELWDAPNVLISPHCSSVFNGWELASIRLFSDNLKRWQNGEPLLNVVDPAHGY